MGQNLRGVTWEAFNCFDATGLLVLFVFFAPWAHTNFKCTIHLMAGANDNFWRLPPLVMWFYRDYLDHVEQTAGERMTEQNECMIIAKNTNEKSAKKM